jgi:hypothetical protein
MCPRRPLLFHFKKKILLKNLVHLLKKHSKLLNFLDTNMLRCILQNIPKYAINILLHYTFSVKIAFKLWLQLIMVHVRVTAPICTNNIF